VDDQPSGEDGHVYQRSLEKVTNLAQNLAEIFFKIFILIIKYLNMHILPKSIACVYTKQQQ